MASAAEITRRLQDTENYPTRFDQSRTRIDFEYIVRKRNFSDGGMAMNYTMIIHAPHPPRLYSSLAANQLQIFGHLNLSALHNSILTIPITLAMGQG